jgi:hypothetical protein
MSLKIMKANDELEKKTKLKINQEVQRLKELQNAMEKRLVGTFEAKQGELVESNRKLQRQITTMSEELGNKFKDLQKKATKKIKINKEKEIDKHKGDSKEKKRHKKISDVSLADIGREKSPKKEKEEKKHRDKSSKKEKKDKKENSS